MLSIRTVAFLNTTDWGLVGQQILDQALAPGRRGSLGGNGLETEGVCLRNSGNSAEREASRELPGAGSNEIPVHDVPSGFDYGMN